MVCRYLMGQPRQELFRVRPQNGTSGRAARVTLIVACSPASRYPSWALAGTFRETAMIAPDLPTAIDRLRDLVATSDVIVPFTGAGISTECGIPDFRSPGGIWTRMAPI